MFVVVCALAVRFGSCCSERTLAAPRENATSPTAVRTDGVHAHLPPSSKALDAHELIRMPILRHWRHGARASGAPK